MRRLSVCLGLLLALAACNPAMTPEAVQTGARPAASSEEYLAVFEQVWSTVNEGFFDPTFGGRDWAVIGDEYRPLIAAAEDDESFYALVNQMLGELEVSHLEVVAQGGWERIQPTLFAPGGVGIDLRLIDGAPVITRVQPGSPGEEAGLRPGYIVQEIDGATIVQIVEGAGIGPALAPNERVALNRLTNEILSRVYGQPGTSLSVAYLDETGAARQATIVRAARERQSRFGEILPPVYLEFETQPMDDGVVYVWFNTFHPALLSSVMMAIEETEGASGLILDLRGNLGGSTSAIEVLARYFLDQETCLCKLRYRDGTTCWMLNPQEHTYDGPVVVLLDTLSSSASEIFAGCLQGIGRVVVVGERSPGSALAANLQALEGGATLLYPMVRVRTMEGIVLEDNGVVPDIEAALSRDALLQGSDPQIEAALEHLSR